MHRGRLLTQAFPDSRRWFWCYDEGQLTATMLSVLLCIAVLPRLRCCLAWKTLSRSRALHDFHDFKTASKCSEAAQCRRIFMSNLSNLSSSFFHRQVGKLRSICLRAGSNIKPENVIVEQTTVSGNGLKNVYSRRLWKLCTAFQLGYYAQTSGYRR